MDLYIVVIFYLNSIKFFNACDAAPPAKSKMPATGA